jgi:hypothetical protein
MFSGVNPQLAVMATIRGGVFTRADARSCGYCEDDIDRMLDSGGWRRVRRDRYAAERTLIPVNEHMLHLRRLHRILRDDPALVASHQSAVALHALPAWGLDLSILHVTSATGRQGRHRGGVYRHVEPLAADDVDEWNGMRLTAPARAVAELTATARRDAAVVVADAAFRSGLVTRASLTDAVHGFRSDRATARARAVLSGATGRSHAVGESRLRLLLRDAGMPEPSPHPPPLDDDSDADLWTLWFAEQRTVVEFEPGLPYWSCFDEDEDSVEIAVDDAEPPPTEHVYVSWPDLDHPHVVIDRVRSAFARAASRSGIRHFDLSRRRRHTNPRRRPDHHPSTPTDLPC